MVRGMGICRVDQKGGPETRLCPEFHAATTERVAGNGARFAVGVGGCSFRAADSSLCIRESDGTPMARLWCCRFCLVEMEPVKLADGTAALVCIDCDVIGLEHEVARGGPMRPAGAAARAGMAKKQRSTRRWAECNHIRHRSRNQLPRE